MAGKKTKEPLVVIVSAPSGSGKTTLVGRLLETVPGIGRSVSYTTRKPRKDEVGQEDYIFISKEEFKAKIENGFLLEWENNFGNYYGTSIEQVENTLDKGEDIVLSIDVKGARKVKKQYPESISIFIMPPSEKKLEERLRKRNTDDEDEVIRRLKEAKTEMSSSDEYDFLIVNSEIEAAVLELKAIIVQERENYKK